MKRLLTCLILPWLISTACAADARSEFQFAPPDQNPPVIVIGQNASPCEKFAAQELSDHLSKMTRQSYSIITDAESPKGPYIAVGENSLTSSLHASDLQLEQYAIDIAPDHIAVGGGKRATDPAHPQDRGTLYGVYDLLEQLGVRWYRPEDWGASIPDLPHPALAVGKTTSKVPAYEMRSALAGGFQRYRHQPIPADLREKASLWSVRNRLNWNETGGDPRFGGQVQFSFEHSYYLYVPPGEYFDKHPEYFPLVNGKRTPTGQLCIGNPQLQELFIQKVIAKAKSNPQAPSVTIDPNDGEGWCECPLCRAMDDPKNPTLMSNRVCAFGNLVARRVAQAVPGMRVHWLAYSAHTQPPTLVKRLEPNTIIQLSTINEWGDYSKALFDSSSPDNQLFLGALKGWHQLKPSAIMTYEYWGGYGWPGPAPIIHAIADRARNYRQFNVTGIYSESEPHWGAQGIVLYFTAKLLWNPDLDLNKELNLCFTNYYGPAAKPMKAYHMALIKATDSASPSVYSGSRGMQYVLTPQLISELGKYINEAQSLAKGRDPYERRVHGDWAGYEFSRMISQVLTTKKHEGKIIERHNGRGSYYQSAKAEQQFDEAMKFLLSFYDGDAVFDFDLTPPDYGALGYLKKDVLENDAFPFNREEELLKKF